MNTYLPSGEHRILVTSPWWTGIVSNDIWLNMCEKILIWPWSVPPMIPYWLYKDWMKVNWVSFYMPRSWMCESLPVPTIFNLSSLTIFRSSFLSALSSDYFVPSLIISVPAANNILTGWSYIMEKYLLLLCAKSFLVQSNVFHSYIPPSIPHDAKKASFGPHTISVT